MMVKEEDREVKEDEEKREGSNFLKSRLPFRRCRRKVIIVARGGGGERRRKSARRKAKSCENYGSV
jgi:hypothetical protein